MKDSLSRVRFCVLRICALAAVCSPTIAFAYIDPGTGGMILQLLLGGLAGVIIVIKLYWHRFLAFFGIRRKEKAETAERIERK